MIPEKFVLSWEDFWAKVKECPQTKIERLQYKAWHNRMFDIHNTLITLMAVTKSRNGNYCGLYDFTYLLTDMKMEKWLFLKHYYCYHWLNNDEKKQLEEAIKGMEEQVDV